jgi:hypothetical protein
LDIDDYNEDEEFVTVTEGMLDPTNPEFTYNEDDNKIIPASVQQEFAGIPRSIRSLATFYNPNPQDEWENIMGEAEIIVRDTTEAAYTATFYDGNPEPKNFREAHMSPDFSNWLEAMYTEFRNMEHKQAWEITSSTSAPTGRKIVGSHWVLANKDDRRYQSRCVAKRFSQVPGNYFQAIHAPAVSDATLHLLMVIKTMFKVESGQFDIATAFLYGRIEEALWMAIPEGYERYVKEKHNKDIHTNNHCLKIDKGNLWFSPSSKTMVEEV